MPQSLHKALPSTTLHYKTSTKYFPVLICTTKLAQGVLPSTTFSAKLAQSTSQHNFVLQSIHKIPSSTTLCCEVCTKHVPVLLCTTKLAQSTPQYDFVLQSLHKAFPSTTSYYTRFAQSTSQYCFVLQSLHNILTSTTLHYKASNSFVLQGLRREYFTLVFTLRAFTQRFFNRDTFPQGNFTQTFLHMETFTHRASF